jgi:hypothetical protein
MNQQLAIKTHFIFRPASHAASSKYLDFKTLWKELVPNTASQKAIFRLHFHMQLQNRGHQKKELSCEADNQ